MVTGSTLPSRFVLNPHSDLLSVDGRLFGIRPWSALKSLR
jgi:hypothetical protein